MSTIRSMWSGAIRLGLLNVPVTVGKAWSDERETSLLTLCDCCDKPIDRTERCPTTGEKPQGKKRGVQISEDTYKALAEGEYNAIEDATKSDTLDVLDAQPLDALPLQYATGTYYLRADKKAKGSEQVFGILTLALAKSGMGMVVKWCRSATQKLAIIHARDGILYLTTVPMYSELRTPGQDEIRHFDCIKDLDENQVNLLAELLAMTRNEDGFVYEAYENEGVKLRSAAVEKVINGEEIPDKPKVSAKEGVDNIMALLKASVAAQTEKAPS